MCKELKAPSAGIQVKRSNTFNEKVARHDRKGGRENQETVTVGANVLERESKSRSRRACGSDSRLEMSV